MWRCRNTYYSVNGKPGHERRQEIEELEKQAHEQRHSSSHSKTGLEQRWCVISHNIYAAEQESAISHRTIAINLPELLHELYAKREIEAFIGTNTTVAEQIHP